MKRIITASELVSYGKCGMLHWFQYEAGPNGCGVKSTKPYIPFIEGHLLHHTLEIFRRTGQMRKVDFKKWYAKAIEPFVERMEQADRVKLDKRAAACYGACLGYKDVYPDEPKEKWIGLEEEFEFEIPQCTFRGKIDGYKRNKAKQIVLDETKFISESWAIKLLSVPMNIQRWMYIVGVYSIEGEYPTILQNNYIYKTGIRPKKEESDVAFERRVIAEYTKDKQKFFRDTRTIETRLIEGALKELIISRVNMMLSSRPDMREEQCVSPFYTCPFLPACTAKIAGKKDGWDSSDCAGLYVSKERRHEELKG